MKKYNIVILFFVTLLITSCGTKTLESVETTQTDTQENIQETPAAENTTEADTSTVQEIVNQESEDADFYSFSTDKNIEVKIYSIGHATAIVEWGDTTLYIDPAEAVEKYEGFKNPDIILLTHVHGDHLKSEVLEAIDTSGTNIIAPTSVNEELSEELKASSTILGKAETQTFGALTITSVPAYNIREDALSFHPEERNDNGYIIEQDGLRIYFSGDSEDTPEMRALTDIDIAFVSMNLPYTMTAESAASAVLEFKPTTVFPYHYRGKEGLTDLTVFKDIVEGGNENIQVELHDWYAE